MSGIAGMYLLDGRPVDLTALAAMAESIAHRGADGRGTWSEGSVGLCQLMLCTTPESLDEELPLVDEGRGLVLTSDARIDNRDELIEVLAIRQDGRPVTDGDVILAAYDRWGDRCPERLVGDFAFAIWDRQRQVLFCARDSFGVRPFYYYRSDRMFAFASEIKALLSLEAIPRRLDETRVASYLGRTELDSASTFYQDIVQLRAAHSMTVGRERAAVRRYWTLDVSREVRLASDEEYDEAFREQFVRAVRGHLRSVFPIGSLLSGGLDSSAIVGVARKLLADNGGSRLHTFSGVFDRLTQCDERSFINAVVARGGVDPHYVVSDRLDPWADIDAMLREQQEPFPGPFLFVRRAFCGLARDLKVRVLLDGSMGDAVVPHGLGHLTELVQQGRWWSFATQVRVLKRTVYRNYTVSLRSLVWERGIRPLAPVLLERAWRLRWRASAPYRRHGWAPILNPSFARRIHLAERLADLRAGFAGPARTAREEHRRYLASGLYHSFGVTGRTAAAFGLSASHPFADRRLVEFCLALPSEQRLRQGWSRLVFRRALADVLPDEVRWRRDKSNLQPLVMSMLFGSPNRALVERTIFEDARMLADYLDLGALRDAYRRCAAWERRGGYASRSEVQDALQVWRAIILTLWFQARLGEHGKRA
jgi:asparagine synthase (glutamine-hydrolysing)